jgi:ATP-dependent Clp protease ATP-binding subunit ClpC
MEIGFEPALGARPLRRAVQREIEDRISEQILQGELKNSSHIKVDFVAGEFVFISNVRESVAQTA